MKFESQVKYLRSGMYLQDQICQHLTCPVEDNLWEEPENQDTPFHENKDLVSTHCRWKRE